MMHTENPQASTSSQDQQILEEVVVRFAEDSGDGIQVTGGQLTMPW